ncbi:hypothetical protein BDP27DRAFT_1497162 [Rhodocollybia butyracea]|uniref:Uncharacterized protein n=1 Tax=Rhodocollybia butyracea TaxID=206335 RepID=A0A9P5TYC4_9AGAR|nr:hypothetical protein BDP27DRAFT_1497162 [Rhodocollybia butyracea]
MDITASDLLRNRSQREDDGSGHAKSTVTLSLPSYVKDLPSVAKLYSFFNQLTYSDGLVGALLATTKEFITSPNCDYLPDPRLGSTCNLYCCNDARYGQDDPICWPQPYNPRYPFYAAISKKPTDSHSFESSIMWLDLREGDLSFTSQALQRKIALLKPRVSVFYEGNPDSTRRTFLKENIDSINLFLTCLGTVSATLRDQQRGLTELQRAYLTAKAILDFHQLVEKPGISDTPATVDTNKMGCFVWNDTEARMLYFAGLPVFYIRPWSAFDRQIIEKVSHVIQHASHPSNASQRRIVAPKLQRNVFGDLPVDDPLVPPAIPAWRDVNETIWQDGVTVQKKLLVAPDAGLFFGLQTESCQAPYFFMWQHFRPVYLRCLHAGTLPRSVEFWRKMLSYPFLNLVERNAKVTGKLQIQLEAQIYVEDSIKAYNANMAFHPPSLKGAADPVIARRLIQLMHTDKLLDQSRPQPSRDLTIAELDVAVSRHQRERNGLIEQIFFYIGLEPDPSIDYGIVAVDWGTRYKALKKFCALLDTWHGDKSLLWRRGIDMDLIKMEYAEGAQWERLLAEFYVQNVFSVLGRPLSLPRRL